MSYKNLPSWSHIKVSKGCVLPDVWGDGRLSMTQGRPGFKDTANGLDSAWRGAGWLPARNLFHMPAVCSVLLRHLCLLSRAIPMPRLLLSIFGSSGSVGGSGASAFASSPSLVATSAASVPAFQASEVTLLAPTVQETWHIFPNKSGRPACGHVLSHHRGHGQLRVTGMSLSTFSLLSWLHAG